jgi:sugar phosphate isomerase/epimerase
MAGITCAVRLGLWLDDLGLDIRAALKAVAPIQPEAVGLDAFRPELSPRALGQTARRDLARLIKTTGAALAALYADLGGRRLADAAALDANLGRVREALQLASDLGAAHLVVQVGYVPPLQSGAGEQADAAARAALAEAARALRDMSASSRARVAWAGGNEAPEALAEFLRTVDSSGILDVDLNPGAYVMRGHDPLKALQSLSSRVALARAVDYYRGGGEAPFGRGDVPWGEVLVGLSTLSRPVQVLAGCALACDRPAALERAYGRLAALRQNPMG